ncbi:MAG: alpha/beta hydrolase [Anaerolineales bacterium]
MPERAGLFYFEHRGGGLDGGGPPLVFVHGAGGDHLHWPPQVRRLPEHTVYALDLPGHGRSGGPGCGRIEDYVERIETWMDDMHISRVILGGHSMGGAITQQFALDSPQRLAGLILVGTGARLRVDPSILEATADAQRLEEAVDAIIDWSFSESAPERLTELARRRMLDVDHIVIHDDFVACDQFDVMDRVNEIKLPALVLCGEQDRLTPMKYSEYLFDKLVQARLIRVPDAGHMVMLEQPEIAARAISEFASEIQ